MQRGWATLSVEGWATKPFYDRATNNLTWAITAHDNAGGHSNHSFFWTIMGPGKGGAPKGSLAAAIDAQDPDPERRPGLLRSCGRPSPGMEIRIVDARDAHVAEGELGEVWMRSRG